MHAQPSFLQAQKAIEHALDVITPDTPLADSMRALGETFGVATRPRLTVVSQDAHEHSIADSFQRIDASLARLRELRDGPPPRPQLRVIQGGMS